MCVAENGGFEPPVPEGTPFSKRVGLAHVHILRVVPGQTCQVCISPPTLAEGAKVFYTHKLPGLMGW